jgi:hypothetical protein
VRIVPEDAPLSQQITHFGRHHHHHHHHLHRMQPIGPLQLLKT